MDGNVHAQLDGLQEVGGGKSSVHHGNHTRQCVGKGGESFNIHDAHGWVDWCLTVEHLVREKGRKGGRERELHCEHVSRVLLQMGESKAIGQVDLESLTFVFSLTAFL